MNEEELATFIIRDPVAWRIWMNGYEAGLHQGHEDERHGMENLADLIARRQLTLQHCADHIKEEMANTRTMEEVARARASTRIGSYTGGPVPWEQEPRP
jgi:hypothetical protein